MKINPNHPPKEKEIFQHNKNSLFFLKLNMQELKGVVADLYSTEDATQVTNDLLQFHNQLVLLLHYNVLNCDGMCSPSSELI